MWYAGLRVCKRTHAESRCSLSETGTTAPNASSGECCNRGVHYVWRELQHLPRPSPVTLISEDWLLFSPQTGSGWRWLHPRLPGGREARVVYANYYFSLSCLALVIGSGIRHLTQTANKKVAGASGKEKVYLPLEPREGKLWFPLEMTEDGCNSRGCWQPSHTHLWMEPKSERNWGGVTSQDPQTQQDRRPDLQLDLSITWVNKLSLSAKPAWF